MSSNLKVNTILPSTGSNVAIGTVGGTVTIVGNVDIDINSGISTFNDIHISDKIVHDGDINTSLRFPAADTITAETGGSERLRIDSDGRLLVGQSSVINGVYGSPPPRFSVSTSTASPAIFATFSNNTYASRVDLLKSRNATVGSHTVVQAGDALGEIYFGGSDGDQFHGGALIQAVVESGVGNDDMPANLRFYTNSGTTTVTERLRIDSNGNIGAGTGNTTIDEALCIERSGNVTVMAECNTSGSGANAAFRLKSADSSSDWYMQSGNVTSGGLRFYDGNAGAERLRIDSSGRLLAGTTGNSGAKIQIGNHTFEGATFVHSNDRVGFQNNGNLTCISNCSTYNDGTYPGYGLVLVQGASTSSYNVWGICPDGPAKGNSLNFHYGAQETNIHQPSKSKFEFTGEGYALTPNMPYCMLGRGSNQSITNTTGAVIYFDTKNVDRGNNYNTSNARFTAPVAGDYLFCLIVEYSPSTGVSQCHTGMWKNGSHNFGYSSFDGWNNMGDNNRGGSMVVVANLAQNDYVQFATYHAHGSTQQLVAGRTKATIRFLG